MLSDQRPLFRGDPPTMLTTKQTRILSYLAQQDRWCTRQEMEPFTGAKGFSKALGAATRELKPESLEARGFVERKDDNQPFHYRITPAGRAALSGYAAEQAKVDEAPSSCYLLAWNPEHYKLGGDGDPIAGTEQRWTCHSQQPQVGDRVYLVRLGVEPKGIVATGLITQGSFEEPHWKDPAKSARYVRFLVEEFRPDTASGLLPMALLTLAMPDQRWSPQRSGVGIRLNYASKLDQLWRAGANVHSLGQYVRWVTNDPEASHSEWVASYSETVALAERARSSPHWDDPNAILTALWRSNGVSNVGQGAISSEEFESNQTFLEEVTRLALNDPSPEVLASVETRWQEAVSRAKFHSVKRAVVRRLFAAASPERYTTALRETDCERLLVILRTQFQLPVTTSTRPDWATLNQALMHCARQAGLESASAIQTNVALWTLLENQTLQSMPETAPTLHDDVSGRTLVPTSPKNLILFGPPGTGKTYSVIDEVIAILAPELLEGEPDRHTLKSQFDRFVESGRVVFTTFHQSFSYEDFVEGIRAETDGGQLRFSVVDGVFKRLCRGKAPVKGPGDAFTAGESIAGYVVHRSTSDVLEIIKPNGSLLPIGMSLVNELARLVIGGQITIADIRDRQVFERIPDTKLEKYLVNGYQNVLAPIVERLAFSTSPPAVADSQPKVLVIDEINRGNLSKIFGELITLIEPSKRAGMPEALEVTLPYSKERFSVPSSVHIIATMNTADRSLVGLDIALRRRFVFREVPPRPELLDDVIVDGVSVGKLLRVMNDRISYLLGPDHRIGHAYFLPLRVTPTLDVLARIFRGAILPLLQEYFFDDWSRIRLVLNDHRKPSSSQFLRAAESGTKHLFGSDDFDLPARDVWELNSEALFSAEAYEGVIEA